VNSKDLGVDGSIILDLILLIKVCGYSLNSCGSGQKKANQYITEIYGNKNLEESITERLMTQN
jgi:hypothetical protein